MKPSPPAWGRGLKLVLMMRLCQTFAVAPRVGAWIETTYEIFSSAAVASPPAWGRGLKHQT